MTEDITFRPLNISDLAPRLPSYKQEEYAEILVNKLRERHLLGAGVYAGRVLRCKDRGVMSGLIDDMKKIIEDVDEEATA
jgi:hypothetical protein